MGGGQVDGLFGRPRLDFRRLVTEASAQWGVEGRDQRYKGRGVETV